MDIRSRIRGGLDVAVFTRNHPCYLKEASEIAKKDPAKRITFRARSRWVSADEALHEMEHHPISVYIAPIDGETGRIEYVANLHKVLLDPKAEEAMTEKLLAEALPSTKDERLWDGKVSTLYVISNCHKAEPPFSIAELSKVSDDTPLSEDYKYSYSIVKRRAQH